MHRLVTHGGLDTLDNLITLCMKCHAKQPHMKLRSKYKATCSIKESPEPQKVKDNITDTPQSSFEVTIKVKDMLFKKVVKRAGKSGRIYVPSEWIDQEVMVILEDKKDNLEK